MAYTLFDKTEIASYTDVAALLCVAKDYNEADLFWKYQLYGNLCWNYKNNALYHCGKYAHFTYMEFENEDRIDLKKLPQDTSCNQVKYYFDQGYLLLLPINTKALGYTNVPYKHNVFVTGYENDDFIVFDFWTPSFTWKHERVNCKRLFESIDFTNDETVQMIYAFKYNVKLLEKYDEIPDWTGLKEIYDKMWNTSCNMFYDNQKNAYGRAAYQALCEHLKLIDKLTLTDSQNMHIIYDHLRFTKNNLNKLFGDGLISMEFISVYDELIKCANRIRTITYIYYISQRNISKIRNFLVEEITNIGDTERIQIKHIMVKN